MKVLLVDDALTTYMKEVPEILKSYGKFTEVIAEGTIDRGKKQLSAEGISIDVAIIDQFVSGKRGTDLGAWINNNYPHISCILLTGGLPGIQNAPPIQEDPTQLLEIVIEALESGFSSFWLKSRVIPDSNDLYKELDRFLALPGVQAKQKLKQDLLNETQRADNAVEQIGQTWERFIESIKEKYPIEIIAWTYIRLLCIEKCYTISPRSGVTTLNYLVPYLEDLCSAKFIKQYGYHFNSLQNAERRIDRFSDARIFIDEIKTFLNSFDPKLDTDAKNLNKEEKAIQTKWKELVQSKYDTNKTKKLNALTDFLNYKNFKKDIKRQKKSMKVFMDSGVNDFKNIIEKHPQYAELAKAIEKRVPLV